MKIIRRENMLVIISIMIFFYALFLNIFHPIQKTSKKNYGAKEESGLKTNFKKATEKNISSEVSGLAFGYLLGEKEI